jgi:hypothetical protein
MNLMFASLAGPVGVLVLFFTNCGQPRSAPSFAEGMPLAGTSKGWRVLTPNTSQVVILQEGADGIARKAYFVEMAGIAYPDDLVLPPSFTTVALAAGGKRLDCNDGSGKQLSFSIDAEYRTGPPMTLGAKGLSELNDDAGWDLGKVGDYHGSGWELLGRIQVKNPGPEPEPGLCASGGPGATDCSQSWSGSSCSVSCGGGYYACCYQAASGSARCQCLPNK